MAEVNFFNYSSAIQTKSKIDGDDKAANGYMIMVHLSHCHSFLPIVNKMNEQIFRGLIPNKCIYKYFYDKIPRGKQYIRGTKKNAAKDAKIDFLTEKYGCSKREAAESIL